MRLTTLCLALAATLAAPAAFAAAPAPFHATTAPIIDKVASTVVVRRHRGPMGGTRVVKKKYSVGPMGHSCKTVTIRKKGPMGHVTVRKMRRCM